jgi:hypothetical protein
MVLPTLQFVTLPPGTHALHPLGSGISSFLGSI